MKLWILYSKHHETVATYSPELMCKMAEKNGINHELFYFNYFSLKVINNKEVLFYKNEQVTELPDVVFCRGYYFELFKHLELNGVVVINSHFGMETAKNKYKTHLMLNKLKINQPKTIFANYIGYQNVVSQLGSPFIMKDNFGSRGINVYLISSEQEFDAVKEEHAHSGISFIYQQFISSSKGKDIRVYVVGDKVVGAIKRTSSSDDFRANLSQGGVAELIEVDDKLSQLSLNICKRLKLEIAGLDFLLDEKNQPVFCEANGNAAFSGFFQFGFNMQDIFMKYIADTYSQQVNFVQQKKQLESKKNSFEVLEGSVPILLSAPHNVMQVRNLKLKVLDIGTGNTVINVSNKTGAYGILKTHCKGVAGKCDDDANFEKKHIYKDEVVKLVKENNLVALLDVHSLKKDRKEHINLGTNYGKNIAHNKTLLKQVVEVFENNGYTVSVDEPFSAPKYTVSGNTAAQCGIFSLQIEINSSLINYSENKDLFNKTNETLCQVVNLLNKNLNKNIKPQRSKNEKMF